MAEERLRILLCEDDTNLGSILRELLQTKGFDVELCADGAAGLRAFERKPADLCLLDVMMPKKDGLTLAQDIRSLGSQAPIIFLTAMGMRENVLDGFRAGADDYITKPFSMEELLLRINAIMRRINKVESDEELKEIYYIGDYTFNTTSQLLYYKEVNTIRLTTKESELLSLLCLKANHTLERSYALKEIWGIEEQAQSSEHSFSQRSMDVYITKLRRMLSQDPRVEIKNVHGKGYKLVAPIRE